MIQLSITVFMLVNIFVSGSGSYYGLSGAQIGCLHLEIVLDSRDNVSI
jgi:hypothetical protein